MLIQVNRITPIHGLFNAKRETIKIIERSKKSRMIRFNAISLQFGGKVQVVWPLFRPN